MKRPLRAILIILIIAAVLLQINFFTGAATTQSTVTIMPAPPQPPGPGPAPAPAVPGAPAEILPPSAPVEGIHYIGDFAVRRIYPNVKMMPEEIWVYTYKQVNHTIILVYTDEDYAEFTVTSSVLHVKVYVGETVQIDSDQNGYSDVKITLNSIKDGRADITLEIPFEEIVFSQITGDARIYYLIFILLALLIIDTIIHHRKAGHIFKHTGRVYR
jgi:hypothetical protein